MNFETLSLVKQENILIVTMNRPEVCNAINFQMMTDLRNLWLTISDHSDIRCIVLTGTGIAFCAGADLKERKSMNLATWKKQHRVLEESMLLMIDCPIPLIAAVNGAAYGGGLELLLACDFAYAAKDAIFSQSETKLGLIPGAMGTQNLPRACGLRRAKELTFTAASFSAEQAYEWHIINKICKPEDLMSETLIVAQKICENAPIAIRQAKKAMNITQEMGLKLGYDYEIAAYDQLLSSKDLQEGILAFNEKRRPKFLGK